MDVKSTFLYRTIEEEVYVCQPLGFKDPDYPNKVYVDDIIFRSTNKELCKAFEKLMKDKFQMILMGELTFFLGLQLKQKDDGIFISQDKYVAKILRKFGLTDGKSSSTFIDTKKPLLKDPDGEDMDTVVATSSTEAEYVAAESCCAQVLWIQNQLMNYGHFLNAVSSKLMLFGLTIDAAHLILLDSGFLECSYVSVRFDGQPNHLCFVYQAILDFRFNKKSNDVVRLQALIDRKKVIITDDTIRQALRLNDADAWIGKGFSRVDTPLFDGMLVQQQVQAVEDAVEDEDDDNDVSVKPTPPSPTPATPPPSPTQEHIPSPP
nr:hypothetical protein [Tanacetum cinerariifolium]